MTRSELLSWLHDVLPGLDRRVEPVVAATRLPDVPLHDGTARPDGTVLLLHTTVMADSDADALAALAPLQNGPLAGRELGHVQGPDERGSRRTWPRRGRTPRATGTPSTARGPTRRPASLAPMLQALWSELETEHSFSIWYGWAPRARPARHGVLGGGGRLRRDVRDLRRPRRRRAVHRVGPPPDGRAGRPHGTGVYLGDTDFTRRQDRFLSDDAYRRLAAVRAERDPSGRFASYLTADPEGLNVHG